MAPQLLFVGFFQEEDWAEGQGSGARPDFLLRRAFFLHGQVLALVIQVASVGTMPELLPPPFPAQEE